MRSHRSKWFNPTGDARWDRYYIVFWVIFCFTFGIALGILTGGLL
jgi:hypothetical protein